MTINALVLIAVVTGGVELAKRIGPARWYASPNSVTRGRTSALTALALGLGATFLVAATVWAHEQVLGGHTLDTLNVAGKVVAGLFVGFGAAGVDKAANMVADVGTPRSRYPGAR